MWNYEKRLQYPVNIKTPNAKLAGVILSQYGGPDGESGAAMRYLSQRYAMPYKEGKAVLTDIATEELGHMEIVASIGSPAVSPPNSWRNRASLLIMWITPPGSGLRQQAVLHSLQQNSSPPAIPSPTFTNPWRRNRRPA